MILDLYKVFKFVVRVRLVWQLLLKCLFLFVFKLLRNKWHHVLPLIIVAQMRTFLVHRISPGLVGSRDLSVLEAGEKRGTSYMTRFVTILVKSVGLLWIWLIISGVKTMHLIQLQPNGLYRSSSYWNGLVALVLKISKTIQLFSKIYSITPMTLTVTIQL